MKKILNKNRQFKKIFTIRMPLCLAEIYLPTHCFGTERLIGRGIHNIAFEMEEGTLIGYFSENDIEEVGKKGLKRIIDKRFVKRIKAKSSEVIFKILNHSLWIDAQNFVNLTNTEILKYYLYQIELIREVYTYFNLSSPAISLAMEEEIDRLFIKSNISYEETVEIRGGFLQSLSKSIPEIEEMELKKIAIKIQENKELVNLFTALDYKEIVIRLRNDFSEYDNLITLHKKKYDFLQGYVDFNSFDKIYFLQRLKELIFVSKINLQSQIEEYENKSKKVELIRSNLIKKYKPDEKLLYLLDLSSYFSFHRMEMRVYFTLGLVSLKQILNEISRRMNISIDDINWTLIEENLDFLRSGKKIPSKIIKERKKLSVYRIEDMKMILDTGKKAEQWRKIYLPSRDFKGTVSVKGKIGNPGIRQGYVKLIVDTTDIVREMGGMKQDSILVTRNTRPDMIIACKKAAAIVTDEGGILSHAALVSREFGIPCVIGTWNATKVFKDGDFVEVDADKGIVRIIK